MQNIIPILIFILILGIVIFIHELGHFLAARRAGIFVEEFALGMGPKLLSKHGRKKNRDGETTMYSLRAFPVGGFCRMRGQDDDIPDDPEALNNKSIPQRALVMAGGSLMNFLLAFVLFFVLVMVRGIPMPAPEILVVGVDENLPGYAAGLRPDDVITHINNIAVQSQTDLVAIIAEADGGEISIRVDRSGTEYEIFVVPAVHEGRSVIGFTHLARPQFARARIHEGIISAGEMIGMQIAGPFRLLSQVIAGEQLAEGEGFVGPIGIGGMITEAYQVTMDTERGGGIGNMVFAMAFFTAAISSALGVMNLLPIPALDGARLVFLGLEAIRRKPVPPEKEALVHMVGLVSLLLLAVFIAYRDIVRLIPGLNDYTG